MGIAKRIGNEKTTIASCTTKRPNCHGEPERKTGCPVPLTSGCVQGLPLPVSLEEGVKMLCSNTQCPFRDQLVHKECFSALEENLIKIISNIGSARGWTDAQRRANLWDKKGLTLIQKKCRCPCGLGLMKVDETAMFLAQREAAIAAATAAPVKSKKKGKNLPKLNFSNGPTATTTAFVDKSFAKQHKKQGANLWAGSSNYENPSATSSLQNVDSTSPENSAVTYSKLVEKWPADMYGGGQSKSDRGGWTQYQSAAPIPLHFDLRPLDKSSSINSKIVDGSVSYAQATSLKPAAADGRDHLHAESPADGSDKCAASMLGERSPSLFGRECAFSEHRPNGSIISPIHVDTETYLQGHDPGCLGDTMDHNHNALQLHNANDNTCCTMNHAGIDMALIMPSPPETPPCATSSVTAEMFAHKDLTDATQESAINECVTECSYQLFSGRSFLLGERLFAEMYLPGLF